MSIPLKDWGFPLGDNDLFVIAGPCAAESAAQVLETARGLAGQGISLFRAGVWKPRTRPGCFEGFGEPAFLWLRDMRAETGLKFAVEVANAHHVETALANGADALWIGARTSVTPFAVQDIADALKGTDIPVLVKNPVNPDIDLWTGALERVADAGIRRIAAVLRGVSGIEAGKYRNAPDWTMALELKRRLPQLPVFCDPSHIAGDRAFLREIAQQAINLSFDGLMLEVHHNPDAALSDSRQQLTPDGFRDLMAALVLKQHGLGSTAVQQELAKCRMEIDQLDVTLLATLARRMAVSKQIGELKKSENMTVLQSGRWEQVLRKVLENGRAQGLSEDFVKDIFDRIHIESIAQQQ